MVTNYYTLVHIANDLRGLLVNRRISSIFSQEKHELILFFDEEERNEPAVLVIGCEPAQNFLFTRNRFDRAKRNTVNLLDDVVGRTVKSVTIHPADREVTIGLAPEGQLIFQCYGSKANVYFTDGRRVILGVFLRKKELIGGHLEQPTRSPSVPLSSLDLFSMEMRSAESVANPTLSGSLKRVLPQFGSVLIRETIHRAQMDSPAIPVSLTTKELGRLFSAASSVEQDVTGTPSPRIYYDGTSPVEFAIIPLEHLEHFRSEEFGSIHEAIRVFIGSSRRDKSFLRGKESLGEMVRKELAQTERTLAKIDQESTTVDQAAEYETMGKTLTANIHLLEKGMKVAKIQDTYDGSNKPISIPLDPHLTPAKNAERYYEKAKRIRRAVEEQLERKKILEQRRTILRLLVEELDDVGSDEALKDFLKAHASNLQKAGIRNVGTRKIRTEEQIPFRVFTVVGGFQVWAGKSSENNDLLTTRYTKQNDLWFHVRGAGGSHVVLKTGTGKGEPTRQAIEQAAAIAAYYSKMKKAKSVPVAACEGKYVRKPKGAPTGTVLIEREKVYFVEPRLPVQGEKGE